MQYYDDDADEYKISKYSNHLTKTISRQEMNE
jgi:hypothetical protein